MRGACAQNIYQFPVQQRPCVELLRNAVLLSDAVEEYSAKQLSKDAREVLALWGKSGLVY